MVCPYCKSEDTGIIASKQLPGLRRRRYHCNNCNERFTTHELAVVNIHKNTVPGIYISEDGCWVSPNLIRSGPDDTEKGFPQG